jgi:hypothetical protein
VEDKSTVSPEVNRLYWETDQSVAEISNRLGVSRRAMYDVIEPFPTGIECRSCGAELYYNNRSAKSSGVARCLVCGKESELDNDVSHEDVGVIPPYPVRSRRDTAISNNGSGHRTAMIAGFACAGVVAGAIATLLIRRKN